MIETASIEDSDYLQKNVFTYCTRRGMKARLAKEISEERHLAYLFLEVSIPLDDLMCAWLAHFILTDVRALIVKYGDREELLRWLQYLVPKHLREYQLRKCLNFLFEGRGNAREAYRKFTTVSTELIEVVDKVLAQYQATADRYREGNTSLIGFLIAKVLREAEQAVDTNEVRRLLEERLNVEEPAVSEAEVEEMISEMLEG